MASGDINVKLSFDPPIQRIEVLRLEPGDILAITFQEPLTGDEFDRVSKRFADHFAESGIRVVFIEGATLSVIRPGAAS